MVFGLSRTFWLTFGAWLSPVRADTVSTIIRNIIRQLETPDRLRGRMSGVNMVFSAARSSASSRRARWRSWVGATFSVVSGGIGCLIATAWVAASTPALRHYGTEQLGSPAA